MTFLAVGIFVLALCFLRGPSALLGLAFLTGAFVDLARRWFEGSVFLLLAFDTVLILLFLSLLMRQALGRAPKIPRSALGHPLVLVGCAWVLFVVAAALATGTNPVVAAAGVRSYLLPIPTLYVGLYFGYRWHRRGWGAPLWMGGLAIVITVLVAALQASVEHLTIAGMPIASLEHSVHSFGSEYVELNSSVFASSKRFGRFLVMLMPLVWLAGATLGRRHIARLFVIAAVVGTALSGSREALVLGTLGFILLTWIEHRGYRFRLELPRPVFSVALVLAVLVGTFLVSPTRARFLLGEQEDWQARISHMLVFPIEFMAWVGADQPRFLVMGKGPGTWGQERHLAEGAVATIAEPLKREIYSRGGLADSGLLRILIELGIPGVILWTALFGGLCVFAFRSGRGVRNEVAVASFVALGSWTVLSLKGHTMINDLVLGAAYWFYVGLLLSSRTWMRERREAATFPTHGAVSPTLEGAPEDTRV